MKKFKKIFAVLLTLAMVLGMGMTSFAYEIPVTENEGAVGATYEHLPLIRPNQTTVTGWEFADSAIAKNFKDALNATDDQTAIWMLIRNQDSNVGPKEIPAATEDQVKAAITNVANAGYTLLKGKDVSTAGVYYIRGTKSMYSFLPMAAYVSFGYGNAGATGELSSDGVATKGAPITTEKTSAEEDKVTEIGRVETYYIRSVVPSIPLSDQNREYWVKDSIEGATYVATDGKITLSVYYGATVDQVKKGEVSADNIATFTGDVDGNSFSANLTGVLENNTHANQPIVITYQAEVTDTTVGNTVSIGQGKNDSSFGQSSENLYTAQLTIIKTEEGNDSIRLEGAGFIISKGSGNDTEYAVIDSESGKFTSWSKDESKATRVYTDANGTLTISGLDVGTYHIIEKTAPKGYSINSSIPDVTISVEGETASAVIEASHSVSDTKLASLPGTGGIGTTIFTIGGCAIMIIAAALFFASRRKSAK